MKRYIILLLLLAISEAGCKKTEGTCPGIEGKWLLKLYFDGTIHPIPDTSVLSETLIIDNSDHFVSYSTRTDKILNEGTIYCTKVFELDSSSFKKGSKSYYNLYQRI